MRSRIVLVGAAALACGMLRCGAFNAADGNPDPTPDDGAEGSVAADGPAGLEGGSTGDGAQPGDCAATVATDPKNCGRCGHDCLGGDCMAGVCQPFVLAAGLSSPGEIALGNDQVYWEGTTSAKRSIFRCKREGCGGNPSLVIADLNDVRSLLVVGANLVFATFDQTGGKSAIETCRIIACPSSRMTLEAPAEFNAFYPFTPLRAQDGAVWWGQQELTAGRIRRASLPSGAPQDVANVSCNPDRITVAPTDVAWTCAGGATVRQCELPCAVVDGTSVVDDNGAPTDHLERGGNYIVYDDHGLTGGSRLRIKDLGAGGGAVSDLPPRGMGPLTLAGDDLIFQDGLTAQIAACRLPACASRTTLAKNAIAGRIAADQHAVVWTDPAQGVVMSVAR